MNHLENEKSPYLVQHRDNPVDWYPWSTEAFELAERENKPVFLSIGYSTCHWCHVMAHESFMDQKTAKKMNETFINIKVDREERPDVDQVYMNVCQMINGSGGWPLSIIMTPDKKPFFAATYIPKDSRNGRVGMNDLMIRIQKIWNSNRSEFLEAADEIVQTLRMPIGERESGHAGSGGSVSPEDATAIPADIFNLTVETFSNNFDDKHGGFGSRPKFPAGHNLKFLMLHLNRHPDDESGIYGMVVKTLSEMRKGGIYDHIGSGFHRYSTDEKWFLPHFEKMLYDQAILAGAYSTAWRITRFGIFKTTAEKIMDYCLREMRDPGGGFYSAQDADSEGREGKFYLWSYDEIYKNLNQDEAVLFKKNFIVTREGNYADEATGEKTGENIIVPNNDSAEFAEDSVGKIFEKLYNIRKKRVWPMTDDKVLANWNGLMIASLADVYRISANPEYITAAEASARFILDNLLGNGKSLHRYRDGEAGIDANLEDYAFFIYGLLEIYQAKGNTFWLARSVELSHIMIEKFFDTENGGFFLASEETFKREKMILRSRDYFDSAMPCGNSVALYDLVNLYKLTGDSVWQDYIARTIRNALPGLLTYPSGMTFFLTAVDIYQTPGLEIIINGNPEDEEIRRAIDYLGKNFLPDITFHQRNPANHEELARLVPYTKSMGDPGKVSFFICQNYTCRQPVYSYSEFRKLLP